jgi:hypothetical protein
VVRAISAQSRAFCRSHSVGEYICRPRNLAEDGRAAARAKTPTFTISLAAFEIELDPSPINAASMSALGQKRTFAAQQGMSALPPIATAKADIR